MGKNAIQSGQHLFHFHSSETHFCAAAQRFINEGIRAGARVQHRLFPHLRDALLRRLRESTLQYPEDAFREFPACAPHPDVFREHVTTQLQDALISGFRGLWLLCWIPEIFSHYEAWREIEQVCGDLCNDHPITIMCCFGADNQETIRRLADICDSHKAYHYSGGIPVELGESILAPGRVRP